MSPGKKKPSLYDLTHAPLTEEHFSELRKEMIFGTDRSSALLGCTLVDVTLVSALRARFAPMSEAEDEALFYSPTSVLSSFSARIKIGRAIGIFGPKLNDMLDTIRRVRNVFAHSVIPLEFTHELIVKECKKLP